MPSAFHGKRFFLTYPQSDFDYSDYANFIQSISPLSYIIFARENHATGEPHRHVCLEFKQTVRGGTRLFDFQGRHPNVQSPRNWSACITYCKKDGDFEENTFQENHQVHLSLSSLASSMTELEFFEHCANSKISFQYAKLFWDRMNDVSTIYKHTDIRGTMVSQLQTFTFNPNVHTAFILKGPSGCGKTTWAKTNMPKPALMVRHIDQLKGFRVGFHKSIIFDDVDLNHWPRTSIIHLIDFHDPSAIHCRHNCAFIPAGIPKVFTCNDLPFQVNQEGVRRRIRVYVVHQNNLFEDQ